MASTYEAISLVHSEMSPTDTQTSTSHGTPWLPNSLPHDLAFALAQEAASRGKCRHLVTLYKPPYLTNTRHSNDGPIIHQSEDSIAENPENVTSNILYLGPVTGIWLCPLNEWFWSCELPGFWLWIQTVCTLVPVMVICLERVWK